MKHSLSLILKTRKLEGIVTCEDHDTCAANKLIQEDAEDMGMYSEYPSFLEWYSGPVTPVRSGAINLEVFDEFVKWSYVEETDSLTTNVLAISGSTSGSSLFYAPVVKPDWGIVHKLNTTEPRDDEEAAMEAYILEECLIGFIPTYRGVETEFRPGFITVVETGRDFCGEPDIYWTYAE